MSNRALADSIAIMEILNIRKNIRISEFYRQIHRDSFAKSECHADRAIED